jgi:hypothetical protein
MRAEERTDRHDENNGSLFEILQTRLKKPPLLELKITLQRNLDVWSYTDALV